MDKEIDFVSKLMEHEADNCDNYKCLRRTDNTTQQKSSGKLRDCSLSIMKMSPPFPTRKNSKEASSSFYSIASWSNSTVTSGTITIMVIIPTFLWSRFPALFNWTKFPVISFWRCLFRIALLYRWAGIGFNLIWYDILRNLAKEKEKCSENENQKIEGK